MITKMKKLISTSTIPVLALALLLVFGTVLADPANKPAPSLSCTITYTWMPGWVGTISGDIEGVVIWFPGPDPMRFAGQTSHYTGSWEIWNLDETELLLYGEGAGSTTVRHRRNSIWRSNGIVLGASDDYADWIGRRVHQGGWFTWDESVDPVEPEYGEGTFRIN